ncbi:DUF2461 domain-containing protein [Granulicella sibirica]|uniref:TIGR02453 family protein n=1 Tax=Granulicella sibirica TaxID=2479048 RepID=A0A4Q0T8G5_9BACT|nr:DUF2461 domain-containing protein [Granulicella sibirica]RXH58448.1 hypothetical protein GRAN_1758 [Granulicella sibirica]
MPVHFSENALKFLRGLTRHNDREWFGARKTIYETELKAPMLELIGEINDAFLDFAPEHVRPPQKAMMRIYRDIRFSANKAPYKTRLAAWWSRDGMEKTSGAGFYTSFGPTGLTVAAGVYAPDKFQLLAIRRHLVEHHAEFLKLLQSKKMKVSLSEFEGQSLTRPPKGFADATISAEAMRLIMCRQWGVSATLPVETALGPGLTKEVVSRFKLAAPMVALLNEPLLKRQPKPMF